MGALGAGEARLSGRDAACAGCHSPTARGSEEGGVVAPPITSEALFSPAPPRRAAYTRSTLAEAIREGRAPASGALGWIMPRFELAARDMSDLLAYLECVGEDRDPGVSTEEIRLGAALPLSGPLAGVGVGVRAVLSARLAELNAEGGIFRHRLTLVVEDSAAEPAGEREAMKRLFEKGVFALVGSAWSGSREMADVLSGEEVPLVGPTMGEAYAWSSERETSEEWVFRILPGPEVIARAAMKHVAGSNARPTVLVVHAGDAAGARWAEGAREEAVRRGLSISEISFVPEHFDPESVREAARRSGARVVLFWGRGGELEAAERGLDSSAIRWIAPASILSELPGAGDALRERSIFVHPGLVGPDLEDGMRAFFDFLRRHSIETRPSSAEVLAYVAVDVLVEALKRAGAMPTRSGLVTALEGMRDFDGGLVPALTFGKNRRVGVMGARFVRFDPGTGRPAPAGDWVEVTP